MVALGAMAAAAILFLASNAGWYLVVSDGKSGEELASYPLEPGEQFAVGFIHSVNLRPLIDVYEVSEDGAIIVGNIHQGFEKFTCSVGMVSDRTLMLGDIHPDYPAIKPLVGVFTDQLEQQVGDVKIISLSNLCGRRSIVSFQYEHRLF